ncbi:hypothetical protein RHMOL_Rhmol01G0035800 [Rhododendron molle]|uniref:Uncharacterized protein n=1 Tax=Rhododendron molle TaxID=49168 RepID=A0ACC0Q0D6_RHOML|nr:hypothetical protein RHMOL_Rhmol01G0035800 [Rhododendron molle]
MTVIANLNDLLGCGCDGFCLPVASICQVMLSFNGSEHVLSSWGAQNDAKEHLELGHCGDEPIVHDCKSLDRRSGRMRTFSKGCFSCSDESLSCLHSFCCWCGCNRRCVGLFTLAVVFQDTRYDLILSLSLSLRIIIFELTFL